MNWCALMRHRPLTVDSTTLFWDKVTGRSVRAARCRCGIEWLTDGGRWFGFKMRRARHDDA